MIDPLILLCVCLLCTFFIMLAYIKQIRFKMKFQRVLDVWTGNSVTAWRTTILFDMLTNLTNLQKHTRALPSSLKITRCIFLITFFNYPHHSVVLAHSHQNIYNGIYWTDDTEENSNLIGLITLCLTELHISGRNFTRYCRNLSMSIIRGL